MIEQRLVEIEAVPLARGFHGEPGQGMCVMEAVAYVAGEPWSDHPSCACPVISAFLRRWNDDMGDADRQILKPFVTRLVGTKASHEIERRRAWMAVDWLIRYSSPAWLDAAGMTEQAATLRALPEFVSRADWIANADIVRDIRDTAAAAYAAGVDAGYASASNAAAYAYASSAYAYDAAAYASSADAAAYASSADAAAYAASAAAVRTNLRPAVVSLQQSALGLLDRMITLSARGTK